MLGRFEVEGNLLTFTPDEAMERGAHYQGRIAAGVKTVDGRAVTESDYLWSFATVPDVTVSHTSPIDGADNIVRGDGVAITFSTPMKTSALTVTLQPTITNQAVHWDDDSRVAKVSGGFEPSQEYLVTVQKAVGRYDGILEEPFTFGFSTAQLAPRTTLHTGGSFGVYSAAHPQVVWMTAINREVQELSLTEMSTEDLVSTAVDYGRFEGYRPSTAPPEALKRTWAVDMSADLNIPNTVSTTLAADGGSLRPGAYHLVSAQSDRRIFVVSDVNVTLKSTPDELLVWVTDLESGRDVENALISVFDTVSSEDRSAVQISEGSTDADGVWRARIDRTGETWDPIVVVVERDGRFAGAAATDWADGIEPWSFDVPYDAYPSRWAAGVYTDRPVYRAGQSVNFRGVARLDDDAAYELPLGATVKVTLRDPNYETVMETSYSLDEYGTFDGNFPLSVSAPLGGYRIEVLLFEGGEIEQDLDQPDYVFSHEFRVAAYRKPDFEVSVTTEHPAYVDGDTIKATIQAEYAFGGPVGQADVTWRLLRDDFFFESPLPGYWRFTDYRPSGGPLQLARSRRDGRGIRDDRRRWTARGRGTSRSDRRADLPGVHAGCRGERTSTIRWSRNGQAPSYTKRTHTLGSCRRNTSRALGMPRRSRLPSSLQTASLFPRAKCRSGCTSVRGTASGKGVRMAASIGRATSPIRSWQSVQ